MTDKAEEQKSFEVKLTDDHLLLIHIILMFERGGNITKMETGHAIQRAFDHIKLVRWEGS